MHGVTSQERVALDVDVLRRLGERAGVQTWPVILDLWAAHSDSDDHAAATVGADRTIGELGLLDGGEPTGWLAAALRALSAPERQLEIRTMTGRPGQADGIRRMCVARNGHDHVLARREGSRIELRQLAVSHESELGAVVAREFGEADGVGIAGFSAPADELAARLVDCRNSNDTADALHALGAPSSDAIAMASALMSCHARSEIVAVSWSGGAGAQSSGALAIFDTDRGRIVASPSKSPDGRVWTTLSPGSGHRIGQAVGLLIETLPEGRWMP
ncbi:ESX secretion-associated protein EspG [Gordonia sp. SL306]|uniref:ESX secretion-associated protein EspG n=1 Tax=Gordonia sp. SL306 TaxID=2995145 RepID=UPI00226D61F2|nr:ESX secretion-associated protein EspG [Gordonia sp. SL306]WAC56414.1 ESX secretion-associated protein EspG [Gordonia sp. SL306]